MQFALAGISLYRDLPQGADAQVMGRQFLRSASSVGANTRSAFKGRSKKEFLAKLGIVIEEADECSYWLELMSRPGISSSPEVLRLMNESDQLVSIFTSIVER